MLERLVRAGMTRADVSLHTLDPEIFRELVRADPKLLDKCLAGLRNLADYPDVSTTLVVVLTRINLATAGEFVARVAQQFPQRLLLRSKSIHTE